MANAKTRPTELSVDAFLSEVDDPQKVADSRALIALMQKVTGQAPRIWGPSIVGFGSYHYRYESGREGDSCLAGFSPRKAELSVYLTGTHTAGLDAERDALLVKLGKHRAGKGCLYIKRLSDIDLTVLEQLVRLSVNALKSQYASTPN